MVSTYNNECKSYFGSALLRIYYVKKCHLNALLDFYKKILYKDKYLSHTCYFLVDFLQMKSKS